MKYHVIERGPSNAYEYLTSEPGGKRSWTKNRWAALAYNDKRTAKKEAKEYLRLSLNSGGDSVIRVLTVHEL